MQDILSNIKIRSPQLVSPFMPLAFRLRIIFLFYFLSLQLRLRHLVFCVLYISFVCSPSSVFLRLLLHCTTLSALAAICFQFVFFFFLFLFFCCFFCFIPLPLYKYFILVCFICWPLRAIKVRLMCLVC